MLAGAFSMAAGEWVSMKSQREMFEREISQEREELRASPADEARELELIYRAKGIPQEDARRLAEKIVADPAAALDTLAREELGLDPQELGSPWGAAISSFGSFLVGAIIPILPYMLVAGPWAMRSSLAASALALFGVGALLSFFTARNAFVSGLRMFLIGASVAALTWSIGRLVGVSLS
jgi:VIT1/CCC1 family predicted Fe2+/Mn2+ transporter